MYVYTYVSYDSEILPATSNKTQAGEPNGKDVMSENEQYDLINSQADNDHLQKAAFLAKSLSDSNRLRILLLISSGRKSVSAIVEGLELSQPLVSHHLKELKRALLVKVEREGPFIYYELADARILNVLQTLSEVATDLLTGRKTF